MDEPNDNRVTHRLRALFAGERSGAEWLYDTFAPSYFARLRRRYRYVDPEDLLHDAFVLFFRNDCKVLRDFDRRTPPEAQTKKALDRHLWGLVCGLVSNHRRSAAFLRWRSLPDSDQEVSPQPSAESTVIDRDQLERLDACLQESGERLYLYFKLRYREDLSPEEIARATGWSRKATYKLKQTFRRAFRLCAERLGIEL